MEPPAPRSRAAVARALAALAGALALMGGPAHAAGPAFVVIPAPRPSLFVAMPQSPVGVPSAARPNLPEEFRLPSPLTVPPAVPERLDRRTLWLLWQQAGAAYGIPWQVLASINQVESALGRNMGPSSAGAIGWMQFMPATWLRWGVDANHDGVADPWNAEDAIFAAARYLAASGGATDLNGALLSYNHAQWYANEVIQLAGLQTGGGPTGGLAGSRTALVAASRELGGATARERAAELSVRALEARARTAASLSARLDLEPRIAAAQAQLAAARVATARGALAEAWGSSQIRPSVQAPGVVHFTR